MKSVFMNPGLAKLLGAGIAIGMLGSCGAVAATQPVREAAGRVPQHVALQVGQTLDTLTAPKFAGSISASRRYPGLGITMDPPGNPPTTISWTQAYGTCSTGASACGDGFPVVELAYFSDSTYGTAQADGSIKPFYTKVLTWVMTWHNQLCNLSEPPGFSRPQQYTCDSVALIDANTGQSLATFGSPPAS